jgi:acetyl esterase/lipase
MKLTTDTTYGRGSGRDLRVDIFSPDSAEPNHHTAILQFHGGAFRVGDKASLTTRAEQLCQLGFTVMNVEYRKLDEAPWPAPIHDGKAAIRWTRAHADELGIDATRIVLKGQSSGAVLSMIAAGTEGIAAWEGDGGNPGVSTEVAAVVALYVPATWYPGPMPSRYADGPMMHTAEGVPTSVSREAPVDADGSPPAWMLFGRDASVEEARSVSPASYITPQFPPTCLAVGGSDASLPPTQTLTLFELLRASGVPCDLYWVWDGDHGFDGAPGSLEAVGHVTARFLQRTVVDRAVVGSGTAETGGTR